MKKRIGIFGKAFDLADLPYFKVLIKALKAHKMDFFVEKEYLEILRKNKIPENECLVPFEKNKMQNIDLLISWGGDGTILRAVSFVKDSVPILGINTGRLGFLSTVQRGEIAHAIYLLKKNDFSIQNRTLLQLKDTQEYALNEVSITRKDSTAVIGVKVFLNSEYLTTYWADGLIVATPTGSTAYSLSCGGPIIVPTAHNIIITPISPHNLNARPIVLSDNTQVKLEILTRGAHYLLSLDTRCYDMLTQKTLALKKADFYVNLIALEKKSFLQTLRHKMFFGEDIRNKPI